MSNYIDEKKLQDLLKNGKGIPFISPELIRVLGIDEMYRKQGALEELYKLSYYCDKAQVDERAIKRMILKRIKEFEGVEK